MIVGQTAPGLAGGKLTGVAVLDMSDPSRPKQTATLATPAMQTPHETLALNQARGLLVAVSSTPLFNAGLIDVYDVTADCRNPVLKASAPVAGLGHESGFAPDGRTFYVASLYARVITAVDLSDPAFPVSLGVYNYESHGINVSDDGNRLYMAANGAADTNSPKGLMILDTSEIQARRPNPQVRVVSRTTWALVSTPQINLPVTIGSTPYLVEMDEFATGDRVGAGRIIDITDETKPKVVSNLRLEVNQAAARQGDQANDPGADDPGADSGLQGYAGHYCNVPRRVDPGIVACSFILSGLRVFDIRDPLNPREIAYFNGPVSKEPRYGFVGGAFALSSPTFVPERGEIWYSDGVSGFYAVKLTNGVWPFPASAAPAGPGSVGAVDGFRGSGRRPGGGTLPATGVAIPLLGGLGVLAGGLGLRRLHRVRR